MPVTAATGLDNCQYPSALCVYARSYSLMHSLCCAIVPN